MLTVDSTEISKKVPISINSTPTLDTQTQTVPIAAAEILRPSRTSLLGNLAIDCHQ